MFEPCIECLKPPLRLPCRVFDDLDKTIAFAKMTEAAGASAVAVHGRTRKQKGNVPGPANWQYIQAVKKALRVPVIANGNVRTKADAEEALRVTGCDAIMSANGLLATPALFSGVEVDPINAAKEYLRFSQEFDAQPRMIRPHIFCIMLPMINHRPDLLSRLGAIAVGKGRAIETFHAFLDEVRAEVGSLEDAKQQQARLGRAEVAGEGEAEEEEEEEFDGDRTMNREQYKSLKRQQRRRTKQLRAEVVSAIHSPCSFPPPPSFHPFSHST